MSKHTPKKISTPKKLGRSTSTPTTLTSTPSPKVEGATGGMTEKEEFWLYKKRFIQDFMKLDTEDDIDDFLEERHKSKHHIETSTIEKEETVKQHFSQIPRLSTFCGEDNKGEVNWKTYRFKLQSLLQEQYYSKEQILLGVRRSMKGTASDILRRLGTGVDIETIISKLDSTYGEIETQESCLRQFYACCQKDRESVAQYSTRIEEIYSQAVTLGGLRRGDETVLKNVFFQGLRSQLKTLSTYKHDSILDYDRFKIEVRRIEVDLQDSQKKQEGTHTVYSAINIEKKTTPDNKSEMKEVKELLQTINDRVKRLEVDKGQERYGYRAATSGGYRGGRGSSHFQDRGRGRGTMNTLRGGFRGRGGRVDYSQRNQSNNGDTRTCYHCNEIGHIARNCPKE